MNEKLRSDARVNRDRILEVARDMLTTDPEVSMNSVAKMAGVGPGTLYRHFPSREALVLGVYKNEIDAQVQLAPALLAKHRPLMAFRLWCYRLAKLGRVKHAIAASLHVTLSDKDSQDAYLPMLDAVQKLMLACEASGEILPGNNAADILVLLSCLWRIPPTDDGEAQANRVLTLTFRAMGAEQ
ncbi:TetR/AcrR family transcriptional regulator [Sodalis sp. RH16]|uniref:TetR/AcrR family transcriptional regulator n=1 Tax=Sodalis sp. RH16 TaxID=3394331 RepID=UPI0039B69654